MTLIASSGCRYINSPSAVMKTPSRGSISSIHEKSRADWARLVMRGESGSRRRRSSTTGSKSMVTQRNVASGRLALSLQKLVCRPSASATTVAFGCCVR